MAPSKVVPTMLGGFIVIYGLVSGFVKERLFLSESLVATVYGIIIGPQVINLVDPRSFLDAEKFTLEFARYVIAIQVMAAGITLPRKYMVRKWRTMSILLGPVMVVMWMVTAGIIRLMFSIDFKQALLIASCAAPTDPILANSVIKGRYAESHVPKNVRDALSAESGVNDGLGLPFLFLALYLLDESFTTGHAIARWFYWTWCFQILLSIVIGIVVGYIARRVLRWSESYDLIDKESFLSYSIGLSIFIVGGVQLIGSDDVLACFIAGHSFTWDDWFREETKDAHFQEVLDTLINVSFFVYFGTIIPWHKFDQPELVITPWRLVVCAIMVLLLRRLPIVVMVMRITPALRNYRQSLFAGWFGPIGVGAIFFAETVLEEIEKEPDHFHLRSREIIEPIVVFLILASVLVHGITLPLMYIGKVVRSRSRSISSMSIRNGIASRLSFVSSRDHGIHGVEIPGLGSTVDISAEYGEKSASCTPNSNSLVENDAPAGPLDLTRTITIDDTPRVQRDQMDIHYSISGLQSKLHSASQVQPNALESPRYNHLTQSAKDHPQRSYFDPALDESVPNLDVTTVKPSLVRVKTENHSYYTGPDTHSDDSSGPSSSDDQGIVFEPREKNPIVHVNTRLTTTSDSAIDPDTPEPAHLEPEQPGAPVSRTSTFPRRVPHEADPAHRAAHHEVDVGDVHRQLSDVSVRFVGNAKNPLGRLKNGEIVDYDDPDDDEPESSFMCNNIDDKITDYLNIADGIRILRRATSKRRE